ncbi:non-ribosomal peptide synthetase [Desulfovibrio inopinatus]|uniref:non-ribosomal peptide synthetase n=1 Tax=Desulfovibrio inopinatus TaxID=102109 RepID=UPI0004209A87|nr:non-ribosomal peptide synthetase [Desulfovibrio inopinatus]
MTVQELVSYLEDKGAVLWAEDGALRFRAPKDVINSSLKTAMVAAKTEILAILKQRESGVHPLIHYPEDANKPFPLTALQGAYFVGRSDAYAHGGTSCHGYFELELPRLNTRRLTLVWQKLIERHPMLRAVFSANATQRILSDTPHYEITETNMDDMDATACLNALEAVRETMSHQHFDAKQWPLFELHVSHFQRNSRLHVSMDLLIADYLSISLLMEELGILYYDPKAALPPLEVTFRDVILAEKDLVNQAAWKRDKAYWINRLPTFPDAPALPIKSQEVSPPHFVRRHISLSAKERTALAQQTTDRGISLGTAVLAVFSEILGRWSATNHFALNLTVLNRLPWHEDVMRLVGDFTSVNLLEVKRKAGVPFVSFAKDLQGRLWEDLDHRLFNGVHVLRELARYKEGSVLMPVVFTNTVGVGIEQDARGFFQQGRIVHGISQTPQVWLDCQVMEAGGELHIQWDCLEDIFPKGVLDAMFSAFCDQIRQLIGNDTIWDSPLSVALPPAQEERRAIVNATGYPIENENLYNLFARQAALTPQAPAVFTAEKKLTYEELERRSGGICHHLKKLGVTPGENVAIVLEKSWMQPVAVLGVFAAGCTYIPLDPTWPEKRIRHILQEANVRFILVSSKRLDHYTTWDGVITVPVDAIDSFSEPASVAPPETRAYIIYTSGSTGTPKGVVITHAAAVNTLLDVNRRFGITEKDRVLAVSNLSFDLSVYDILGPLACGGAVVIPRRHSVADPAEWVEAGRRFDATVWNSVPALFEMAVEYGENTGVVPETLRVVLLSGDKIPLTLPSRANQLLPQAQLHSLGGATEASIWSIHYPITDVPLDWPSIPYGKPMDNQTFHVLNSLMEPCPDYVVGDLYIGGMGLAEGYFNDMIRTQEAFIIHPTTGERLYKTGDAGCMLPDGNIRFLGRRDFQVKVRGHRIELGEIETNLRSHPGVNEAVVVAQSENSGNSHLIAYVVPDCKETTQDSLLWQNVNDATKNAMESWLADTNVPLMHAFFDQMDESALMAMCETLSSLNAFPEGIWRIPKKLMYILSVPSKHAQLFRRILDTLCRHGYLDKKDGMYGNLRHVNREMLLTAWDKLVSLHEDFAYGRELMALLRNGALHFKDLLFDQVDPLHLLFPEGRTDVAVAVQFNYTSNYMNSQVVAAVLSLVENSSSSNLLHIFEVGAGVGGTSNSLIPALPKGKCRYTYSDLSTFFLNKARERYKDYPFIDYTVFDINGSLETQGISRASADVVIASNVLHNSVIAADVLRNLRGLLVPGGWLIFIESTRDNLSVMTSMEFLNDLYQFEDERKELNSPFLPAHRWASLLSEAGADHVSFFPGQDHPLSRVGQTVFIARFGGQDAIPDEQNIIRHLHERLPEYMIPSQLAIVSALPVTANGKVDRKALASFSASPHTSVAPSETIPLDAVQSELTDLVKGILSISSIGLEDDFYAAGGDSLLLTQLVAKMRSSFGEDLLDWEETLRYAVQNPTVRALAALVREKRGVSEDQENVPETIRPFDGAQAVVTLSLQTGEENRTPLYLIPDGTANISSFTPLLHAIDSHLPIHALTPASMEAYLAIPTSDLIPTLARNYAETLKAKEKPFLCGYCMGGLVALEVARIIEQRNHTLKGVAVINTVKPSYTINDSLLIFLTFIQEIGIDPAKIGVDVWDIGRAVTAVVQQESDITEGAVLAHLPPDSETYTACRTLVAMSREERLARTFELYNLTPAFSGTMSRHRLDGIYSVVAHSVQGVNAYEPRDMKSGVTLFRRQEEDAFLIPLGNQMKEFWRRHAQGEVEIIDLPGNHWKSMREPGVNVVAQSLATLAGKERA